MQIAHNTAIDFLNYALQWAEMNNVDLADRRKDFAIRESREIATEKKFFG